VSVALALMLRVFLPALNNVSCMSWRVSHHVEQSCNRAWIYFFVVCQEPATGTGPHGSLTGSHYVWLTCGTPTGLRAPCKQSKWRRRSSD